MSKTFIDKNAWLSTDTRKPVELEIPEFGGACVRIRPLTTAQSQSIPKVEKGGDYWPANRETLRLSLVDENGEPMFTADVLDTLNTQHSSAIFSRIQRKISELNGWTRDAEDDAKN